MLGFFRKRHKGTESMSDYHLFRAGGGFFLYDPDTMRLFRLSRELYNFLENGAPGTPAVLRQGRQLYIVLRDGSLSKESERSDWYTLNLIMTHKCNMRCEYCFDRTAAEDRAGVDISFSLVCREIEQINKRYKNLNLAFFGGEPLLKFNEIKNVVDFCEQLRSFGALNRVIYSVTSNGKLLTEEMAAFFNRHHFSFTLSADSCNDSAQGTCVSQKWFPDENRALKKLEKYVVRATVTPEMIGEMYQQYLHFQKRGVRSVAFFPAVGKRIHYTPEDAERWTEQMERIVPAAYQEGNGCRLGDIDAAVSRLRRRCKKRDCLTDDFMTCVDTDGKHYACHRMAGLGDAFLKERVLAMDHYPADINCTLCWARDFCLGLCGYERLYTSARTCSFLCRIYRRQAEWACWTYAQTC